MIYRFYSPKINSSTQGFLMPRVSFDEMISIPVESVNITNHDYMRYNKDPYNIDIWVYISQNEPLPGIIELTVTEDDF